MNDETSHTGLDRRALLKLASAGAAAFTAASIGASPAMAQDAGDWDKTFPKSDRVDHQKVTFTNRYGVPLSAISTCQRIAGTSRCRRSRSPARSAP